MSAQAEKIKSVIVCRDREFKQSAISMLTLIAFPGEKIVVETAEGAKNYWNSDQWVKNLVVDAGAFNADEIKTFLEKINPPPRDRDFSVLFYLAAETYKDALQKLDQSYPEIHFRVLPIKRIDFMEAFYVNRGGKKGTNQANQTKTLPFVEATQHVRETIDLINNIGKDMTKIKDALKVGQRFNGFLGTFAFFENVEGYKQLRRIATIIDDTSRTYENNNTLKEIDRKHYDLLLRAAKCAFRCLQELRDGKTISDNNNKDLDEIEIIYNASSEIKKRSSTNQESVDKLLDEQFKKAN